MQFLLLTTITYSLFSVVATVLVVTASMLSAQISQQMAHSLAKKETCNG